MPRAVMMALLAYVMSAVFVPQTTGAQPKFDRTYVVANETLKAMEQAAPDAPLVPPKKARKVLVYGRVPTHPESVACCFKAMEISGRKTGAFTAVSSGDPAMFLPDKLRQFDVVLMNNTHERTPMLPWDFEQLSADKQTVAKQRQPLLTKSLVDFVTSGRGRVFYCTLGHAKTAYTNPAVMKHYLAGIQFAAGDLPADATPGP